MSRPIKFRAWDKEQNKYVVVQAIRFGLDGLPAQIEVRDNGGASVAEANNYIVEQYTGLKDNNGKEIYEGDIVKIRSDKRSELALGGSQYHLEHYPYTREVKMDSRGVYIEYPGYMLLRNFADLEVIGNIHENKELLTN